MPMVRRINAANGMKMLTKHRRNSMHDLRESASLSKNHLLRRLSRETEKIDFCNSEDTGENSFSVTAIFLPSQKNGLLDVFFDGEELNDGSSNTARCASIGSIAKAKARSRTPISSTR